MKRFILYIAGIPVVSYSHRFTVYETVMPEDLTVEDDEDTIYEYSGAQYFLPELQRFNFMDVLYYPAQGLFEFFSDPQNEEPYARVRVSSLKSFRSAIKNFEEED